MQGVGPESWRSACRSPRCRLTETISCYFYCIPLENPHSPNHLFLFPLSFPHFHLPALSLPLSFSSPSLSLSLSLSVFSGGRCHLGLPGCPFACSCSWQLRSAGLTLTYCPYSHLRARELRSEPRRGAKKTHVNSHSVSPVLGASIAQCDKCMEDS